MSVTFTLDDKDMELLKQRIQEYGTGAEDAINKYLHGEGKESIMKSIEDYTPVSSRKKAHAKGSMPYQGTGYNLSVTVKTKTKYNYLYFPDAGEGTSRKNPKNSGFMEKGLDAIYDKIVDGMLKAVVKEIKND